MTSHAHAPQDVWPVGTMPGEFTNQPEAPLPSRGDGVTRQSHVSTPQFTVYPVKSGQPAPAIIVCPGGGYEILAIDKEGSDIAEWLNSIGLAAVLLKYRVPQNRDGALQDLRRTIRLVRHNSAAWGIDPTKVGVLGFSAGGHLCARLSTNPTTTAPYPHIDAADTLPDRPDFAVLLYPAYLAKDGVAAAELPITASMPPMLMLQAEDDHTHFATTRIYFAALKAARANAELKTYPTGGHGHGLRSTAAVGQWPTDCIAWLNAQGIATT